ncbi:MAG TPA: DUF4282 domain-containing protein [Puia sp.]|nr:DUF4282 domain-containing protein [Puia sp.]
MEQTNTTAAPAPQGFNWRDYFSFRSLITLQIIQIVYIVIAVLITLASLATMFGGSRSGDFGGGYGPMSMFTGGGFIGGLIMLICGNIGWRMWCELIIVFFRINKTLNNIEVNGKI